MGFVLYGGTAIALRLGHRLSIDFDFFNDNPLDKEKIRTAFPFMSQATVLQDETETLTVLVEDIGGAQESHVKIFFFGHLKFGRVAEPELTEDGALEIASLEDLMAHKLKVIESKDYLDIAALLEAGVSLEKGLSAARALFGSVFQPSESLKALTYFEGRDLDVLSSFVKETLISAASQVRSLPPAEVISSRLSACL